jgi:hypothetical protein
MENPFSPGSKAVGYINLKNLAVISLVTLEKSQSFIGEEDKKQSNS